MLTSFFYGTSKLFRGLSVFNETIDFGNGFLWSPFNKQTHNFPPCPVIHIKFTYFTIEGAKDFESDLIKSLVFGAKMEGVFNNNIDTKDIESALKSFISILATHKFNEWGRVVVLIDGYGDIDYEEPDVKNEKNEMIVKDVLRRFFVALDSSMCIGLTKFVLITGIKSLDISEMFSESNKPNDLTFDPMYNELYGFTEKETMKICFCYFFTKRTTFLTTFFFSSSSSSSPSPSSSSSSMP